MAAISLSLVHGVFGNRISDFTVGTLAPNAGDFEVRLNTVDINSKNISRYEMITALEAFIRAIKEGGATVNVISPNSGQITPPLV